MYDFLILRFPFINNDDVASDTEKKFCFSIGLFLFIESFRS